MWCAPGTSNAYRFYPFHQEVGFQRLPHIEALEDEDKDFRAAVASALVKITDQFYSSPEEWKVWFEMTK